MKLIQEKEKCMLYAKNVINAETKIIYVYLCRKRVNIQFRGFEKKISNIFFNVSAHVPYTFVNALNIYAGSLLINPTPEII